MNIKTYIFLIVTVVLFCKCSNDDTQTNTIIKPTSISIVKEDGTFVSLFDCINPNEKYSVMIKVVGEGSGVVEKSVVEYTVNGILYSMTFNRIEDKQNQITLIEGENIVQLVDSGVLAKVSYAAPGEFKLVE